MSATQTSFAGLGMAAGPTDHQGPAAAGPTSRPRPRKGRSRMAALLVEVTLTLGAISGVAIAGITVMAARNGMQPLVVRSGSMEPTIATGSMILVKRIDASAIRVGDILAVERDDHTRVTHRVVTVQLRGGASELTMKGDANKDIDPIPVTVRHAYRLAWQVPMIGKTLAWLATARVGSSWAASPPPSCCAPLAAGRDPGPEMILQRRGWAATLLFSAVVLVSSAVGTRTALAIFADNTVQATSTFRAAPDWVAPLVGSTTIAKKLGYLAGSIKQGGAYYVYANATDTGNPASGVAISGEKADVTAITAAGSAVTLVAGSHSVGGVPYTHRSAELTAATPLSAGSKAYSVTSLDVAGNTRVQTGYTVAVDNTAPAASNVQTANVSGGIAGGPNSVTRSSSPTASRSTLSRSSPAGRDRPPTWWSA